VRNFKNYLIFIVGFSFACASIAELRNKPTTMEEIDKIQRDNNQRANEWLRFLEIALEKGSIIDCENSKYLFYNNFVWTRDSGGNFIYPTSYSKKGETIRWVSSYGTNEFYGDNSTLYYESKGGRDGRILTKRNCILVKGSGANIVRPQDEILAASTPNQIYVKFSDGTSHTYTNVKKMPSDAVINTRIEKDFPGKKVFKIIKGTINSEVIGKSNLEKAREIANAKVPYNLQSWEENGMLFVGGKQVTDNNGKLLPGLKRFIDDTNLAAKQLGVPSPLANVVIPVNYGVTAY
jgi:hypothetical protein